MSRALAAVVLATFVLLAGPSSPGALAGEAAPVASPFRYSFNSTGVLEEAGSMDASWSPYWWLNSGGFFHLHGRGETSQGELPSDEPWRLLYAASNPVDTDDGYHPQNVFRMVTRSRWGAFRQQVYFRITRDNLSDSPNRGASNGVFLLNRYQDQDNLYYTGVRVDGAAVVKKKVGGRYHTMAYRPSPPTTGPGTRASSRSTSGWASPARSSTGPMAPCASASTSAPAAAVWVLVFDTIDDGVQYGGVPLVQPGHGGMRTDFMDVQFENYLAKAL